MSYNLYFSLENFIGHCDRRKRIFCRSSPKFVGHDRLSDGHSHRLIHNQLPPINRMKSPIDRMTVSPDTYALRLLSKILFVIVLPISRSCQSMVYRSVIWPRKIESKTIWIMFVWVYNLNKSLKSFVKHV